MQLLITQQFINLMDLTSTDEVTPTLSGIYFDVKEHKAVATDGHALNTIALPEKWDLESIVKFKPFRIKKNYSAIFDIDKKMIYEIKLITNNSNIQVFENGVDGYQITKTVPVEIIDTKENPYPNYKQCIPSYEPVYRATFDVDNLARLVSTLSRSQGRKGLVTLEFSTKLHGPIKVKRYGENTDAIIMPVRNKELPCGVLETETEKSN